MVDTIFHFFVVVCLMLSDDDDPIVHFAYRFLVFYYAKLCTVAA